LGAGWNEPEFRAFGFSFDHRASRFEEAFEIIRRLLTGERVILEGRFHRVEDAVLLPRPSRRPPLMVGSTGERVLRLALPHVDAWNTWYEWYGNTAEGFASGNRKIDALVEETGREPGDVARSACVLVVVDQANLERPIEPGVTPLEGTMDRIAQGLRDLAEAGADEAILVPYPNTEASLRTLGDALAALD
jgi:alkanesulfonate monooxygenase SsuD/methylene tetrahydromethanopterin reductase-like flavin-dependent oxidoreductase (luciferase family)